MWIFSRPLDALREEDLTVLIANKIRENVSLEYKRQMYGASPEERRKLLRSVVALANAEGGVLIIGMDEDKKDGAARELVPVPNADVEQSRVISMCNDNIAERIPGLRARVIDVAGGAVVVVYVPRSYRRPHMIVADGRTEFVIRHDRQKAPMSIAEVRTAVTSTEELTMKAERFIAARRAHNAAYGFALMGTPLALEEGRVDISDVRLDEMLKAPPLAVKFAPLLDPNPIVRPSLRGRGVHSPNETLEVFRSGHVELTLPSSQVIHNTGPQALLIGKRVAAYLANFMQFVERLRAITSIADPYMVSLHLNFRHDRIVMNPSGAGPVQGTEVLWEEGATVDLGPVSSAHDERPSLAPKRLCDLLWQGFHFEACPYFDEEGRLTGI